MLERQRDCRSARQPFKAINFNNPRVPTKLVQLPIDELIVREDGILVWVAMMPATVPFPILGQQLIRHVAQY
jgi:hypothetical protein